MKTLRLSIITLLVSLHIGNSQIAYVTTSGSGSPNGTSRTNAYYGSQLKTAINQTGITQT